MTSAKTFLQILVRIILWISNVVLKIYPPQIRFQLENPSKYFPLSAKEDHLFEIPKLLAFYQIRSGFNFL